MRASSRLKGPRGRGAIGSEARSAEDSMALRPQGAFHLEGARIPRLTCLENGWDYSLPNGQLA